MTAPHPKITERRAQVEDQTQRSRKRRLIVLAAMVAVLLLAVASTQSALLDVDEIRIVGAERVAPDFLRAAADVELGVPLLGLNTGEIEDRLSLLPEVQSVTATSSWGGAITVEIVERLPVARIESANGTVVVAADGLVLSVIDRTVEASNPQPLDPEPLDPEPLDPEPLDRDAGTNPQSPELEVELAPLPVDIAALPEIAGAMFTTERGEVIPDVLGDALMVAAELPDDIAAITQRIDITVDSLVLSTPGGGAISLGDARDLDEKFEAVRAFLAQVDLSCLDTLNVRAPSVPVIRRSANC